MGIENIKGPKSDKIPERKSKNDDIKKVPGGYSKMGVGRISEKGLKGRSIQQVFDEKEKRMDNTENTGMKKKLKSGGRVNLRGGGCAKRGVKKNAYGKNS
jgi:hypothetical protein